MLISASLVLGAFFYAPEPRLYIGVHDMHVTTTAFQDSVAKPLKDSVIKPENNSPAKPKKDSATVLSETTVTGSVGRREKRKASVTIGAISGQELESARSSHPSGIMNRIAGVFISQLSAEGHSAAIRQPITTKPMYLYLEDGIPTRATGFFNHNALYEVNVPQAGGIEVLKGPGTAAYGSDAIGGVINVLSKAPPLRNLATADLEYGSFGWKRALLDAGTRFTGGGARLGINITDAKSWRDEAPYKRYSATGRVDRMLGEKWFAKALATATDVNQRDLPPVNDSLFQAKSRFNSAPIAYREVTAVRASVMLERTVQDKVLSITPFYRYNTLQLLPSWQISYDPQSWDQRNSSFGVASKGMLTGLLKNRLSLLSGLDVEINPGSFKANQVILDTTFSNGMRRFASFQTGIEHYDYSVIYSSASPYIQIESEPLPGLRLDAGVRFDWSAYNYKTNLAVLQTGAHRVPENTKVSYTRLSPKIGASYDLSRYFTAYGSFRTGFRAPSQGQLFQQNSADNTVDLKPVDVVSYELGIRGDVSRFLAYSITAYDMNISNDIISYRTPANTTEATNAGKTRHKGLETALTIFPAKHLSIDVANTWTDQKYVEWNPSSTVSYGGKKMEQAPASNTNIRLNFTPVGKAVNASVELNRVGGYYMDPANSNWYNGHSVINANASSGALKFVEVYARVNNLLNRSVAETASFNAFQGRQYNLGTPRNVVVGIKL